MNHISRINPLAMVVTLTAHQIPSTPIPKRTKWQVNTHVITCDTDDGRRYCSSDNYKHALHGNAIIKVGSIRLSEERRLLPHKQPVPVRRWQILISKENKQECAERTEIFVIIRWCAMLL